MNCEDCKEKTKIIDKRNTTENNVMRRRQCPKCGKRITTLEKKSNIPYTPPKVNNSKPEMITTWPS